MTSPTPPVWKDRLSRIGLLVLTALVALTSLGGSAWLGTAAVERETLARLRLPAALAEMPVVGGGPLVCPPALNADFRRCRPRLDNRYRLRGVHYFQDAWPYTFWDNLRLSQVDADLERIRGHGFNTIVLMLSWGKFQPRVSPAQYDAQTYAKLDALVTKAQAHGLWVVARVASPEHVPADLPHSGPYSVPDLMLDPDQMRALGGFVAETTARLERHENVYGVFTSWEDVSDYLGALGAPDEARTAYEDRFGRFRAYLQARGTLAAWNAAWGTSYASFDQVPVPARGTRALKDYIDFVSEQIREGYLAALPDSRVALGYEARLEGELIAVDGRPARHGYDRTLDLPAQFDFLAAYYNPYWGARNDGDFVTPLAAATNFARMLDTIDAANSRRLPVFFDQLNLADDTPGFTRTNSKLRYPDDEQAAAELIVPLLLERTVGFSLWAFNDYVGNLVQDGKFLADDSPWQGPPIRQYQTMPDGVPRLALAPGQRLTQSVNALVGPGHGSGAPYTLDLWASTGGQVGRARLRVTMTTARGREFSHVFVPTSDALTPQAVAFPPLGDDQPVAIAIESLAENSGPILIDDVRLWNHEMATGVVDLNGQPRASRAGTWLRLNHAWMAFEAELAVPALAETRQTCRLPLTCAGVAADGWVADRALVLIHQPLGSGPLRLEYELPANGQVGTALVARWHDDVGALAEARLPLVPGRQRVEVDLVGDVGQAAGDRWLELRVVRPPGSAAGGRPGFRLLALEQVVAAGRIGEPFTGLTAFEVPAQAVNRVMIDVTTDLPEGCRVAWAVQGLPPLEVSLGSAPTHLGMPTWPGLVPERAKLYVRPAPGCWVVVAALQGESPRGPNRTYR